MAGLANRADLHIHTTASDGVRSPATVVAMARQAGLAAIAIADHDTIDGIPEAQAAAAASGPELRVVPALEINTDYGRYEAHVLGYFIDLEDQAFRAFLDQQRAARAERGRLMVQRLAELRMPVSWSRVQEIAGRGTITRPHIGMALVEAGHIGSLKEALEGPIARGGAAYVPRSKLTPHEAVEAVHQAGGAAVLAHPISVGWDGLIDELVAAGLDGLEVYHPQHTPQDQRRYQAFARSRGLVVTGGSDYHGTASGGMAAIGEVWVEATAVAELLARLPSPSKAL